MGAHWGSGGSWSAVIGSPHLKKKFCQYGNQLKGISEWVRIIAPPTPTPIAYLFASPNVDRTEICGKFNILCKLEIICVKKGTFLGLFDSVKKDRFERYRYGDTNRYIDRFMAIVAGG